MVWHWLTGEADAKSRAKVEAALLRPLPGRETVSTAVVDFELQMFQKAMGKI